MYIKGEHIPWIAFWSFQSLKKNPNLISKKITFYVGMPMEMGLCDALENLTLNVGLFYCAILNLY